MDGNSSSTKKGAAGWIILIIIIIIIAIIWAIVASRNSSNNGTTGTSTATTTQNQQDDEQAAAATVTNFGTHLQNVSLLAPADQVSQSMSQEYGQFVTPDLLSQWQADPTNAPGRQTSSPWPDSIQVSDVEPSGTSTYMVSGQVIYMTSVEVTNGSGNAGTQDFTATVTKQPDGTFLISSYSAGQVTEEGTASTTSSSSSAAPAQE